MRQDARFGSESVEKLPGALPVVAGFSSRLRIRDIVDGACPVRDLAGLTRGQVIEVLVASRLTSPSPLVHVQRRARERAAGEALGADAVMRHLTLVMAALAICAVTTASLRDTSPPPPLPVSAGQEPPDDPGLIVTRQQHGTSGSP